MKVLFDPWGVLRKQWQLTWLTISYLLLCRAQQTRWSVGTLCAAWKAAPSLASPPGSWVKQWEHLQLALLSDHASLRWEKPVWWWWVRLRWLLDPKEGLMIHWGWDTPAVIIWWFTACALPFKTSSVLHRQGHSQRLQWGSDVCTFSCHLLTEPFSSCLWCGAGLSLSRLALGRCAGRGSSLMCQVITAGHFLPVMPNLTLRRFGQSVVQPSIPVSPQHHPLQCESTSLDFNANLRGRWELKVL